MPSSEIEFSTIKGFAGNSLLMHSIATWGTSHGVAVEVALGAQRGQSMATGGLGRLKYDLSRFSWGSEALSVYFFPLAIQTQSDHFHHFLRLILLQISSNN